MIFESYEVKLSRLLHLPCEYFALLEDTSTDEYIDVVYNEEDNTIRLPCREPSVIYAYIKPFNHYSMMMIGEYDKLYSILNNVTDILYSMEHSIASEIAENMYILKLPKNQTLIHNITNNKEYFDFFMKTRESILNKILEILCHPTLLDSVT